MKRRRWKAPNNPTRSARQVWCALFPGEPWPRGWRVEWAGFMRGVWGLTTYWDRRVLLSYADALKPGRGAVETLVHEFIHVRNRRLRHGKDFKAHEHYLLSKIGLR